MQRDTVTFSGSGIISEFVAVKAETRMSGLFRERLWTWSPVSCSYTRYELEEKACAIFDRDVRPLGESIAHESILRPWTHSIFLRFDLGGCGPRHTHDTEIARLQRSFRGRRVFQGFLDVRHFLPLVREPVVHLLIRPFHGCQSKAKSGERAHILSNEPCEPLFFGSLGPPIDSEGGSQISQLILGHTDGARISGRENGLLGISGCLASGIRLDNNLFVRLKLDHDVGVLNAGGRCSEVDYDKEVFLSPAPYIHIMCGGLHIQVHRVA